jgi:hypothetical protein
MIDLVHLSNKVRYLWRELTSYEDDFPYKERHSALFQMLRHLVRESAEDGDDHDRYRRLEGHSYVMCNKILNLPPCYAHHHIVFSDWRLDDWKYFLAYESHRSRFTRNILDIMAALGKYEYFEYFIQEQRKDITLNADPYADDYDYYFKIAMQMHHLSFMKKLFMTNKVIIKYGTYMYAFSYPFTDKTIEILDWLYEKDMEEGKVFGIITFDYEFFCYTHIKNPQIIQWIIDHCKMSDMMSNFSTLDFHGYYIGNESILSVLDSVKDN